VMEACNVKLPTFEGPLDLLLHLVRKNKLDIRDLPIALIAEQYLEYLGRMRALDLNIAGEYLLMAATLLYLKSRALLPSPPQEEEEEDPREALALRILRYQVFKEAAEELGRRPLLERDVFSRPDPEGGEEERIEVELLALLEALKELAKRPEGEAVEEISPEGLDLRFKMAEILEELEGVSSLCLTRRGGGREELIVALLAALELAKMGLVILRQEEAFGDIWIVKREEGRRELWA